MEYTNESRVYHFDFKVVQIIDYNVEYVVMYYIVIVQTIKFNNVMY